MKHEQDTLYSVRAETAAGRRQRRSGWLLVHDGFIRYLIGWSVVRRAAFIASLFCASFRRYLLRLISPPPSPPRCRTGCLIIMAFNLGLCWHIHKWASVDRIGARVKIALPVKQHVARWRHDVFRTDWCHIGIVEIVPAGAKRVQGLVTRSRV